MLSSGPDELDPSSGIDPRDAPATPSLGKEIDYCESCTGDGLKGLRIAVRISIKGNFLPFFITNQTQIRFRTM